MAAVSLATRQHLARLFKQAPWIASTITMVLRLTRIRYTSGVVGVVLNDQDEVLLVEHVFHPKYPWGLPGGWMEKGGESPAEALKRELREELGIEVRILRPLLVETSHYHHHHLDIAFLCRAENDVQTLSAELLDYRWASFDALPPTLPFHRAAVVAAQPRRDDEDSDSV